MTIWPSQSDPTDPRDDADHRGGRPGRLHRDESATALTEFVITVPIFLIILSGMLMLGDTLIDLNRTEVTAYRNAMSETMEHSQREATEAVAANDQYQLDPDQMSGRASMGGADLRQYPDRGPTDNSNFDLYYDRIYDPSFIGRDIDSTQYSMAQALQSNALMPGEATGIDPLLETPGMLDVVVGGSQPRMSLDEDFAEFFFDYAEGGVPSQQDLWGRRALQDRVHRKHDLTTIDHPFAQDFFNLPDDDLGNIATDLSIGIGTRYGTVGGHAETEIDNEFGNFDYQASYGSHYASAIPPFVPQGTTGPAEENPSAREATRRAAATRRMTMDVGGGWDQQVVYDQLLGFDGPDLDVGGPTEIRFLTATNPEDDEAPPSAEELYEGHLDPSP